MVKKYHKGYCFPQEGYSIIVDEKHWQKEWGSSIVFSHGSSKSKGVAIHFPNRSHIILNDKIIDKEGCLVPVET